jgi:hypothetical protein
VISKYAFAFPFTEIVRRALRTYTDQGCRPSIEVFETFDFALFANEIYFSTQRFIFCF